MAALNKGKVIAAAATVPNASAVRTADKLVEGGAKPALEDGKVKVENKTHDILEVMAQKKDEMKKGFGKTATETPSIENKGPTFGRR